MITISDDSSATAESSVRAELPYLLELVGLCGFAIAQPIFDVTGKSPETFTFYTAGGADVILFATLVALVPPLVLWLTLLPIRALGERARGRAQLAFVGILASLIAFQAMKKSIPGRSSGHPAVRPRDRRAPCLSVREVLHRTTVAAGHRAGHARVRAHLPPRVPGLRAGPARAGT